jgi:hypothetical protein
MTGAGSQSEEGLMHSKTAAAMIAGLVLIGCARQTRLESGGDVELNTLPADARYLPSGTTLSVRLDRELGTKVSRVGDAFTATVENDVVATNGVTVVPRGATVTGKVTGLDNSDHAGEAAAIRIDFERLHLRGQSYPFYARVTATNLQTRGGDSRSETLQKAGIGAVTGAVLGAVLSGGDLDRILLGGAIGAAAGTVISLGAGDVEGVLPAGTRMTLRTTQTVALQ